MPPACAPVVTVLARRIPFSQSHGGLVARDLLEPRSEPRSDRVISFANTFSVFGIQTI